MLPWAWGEKSNIFHKCNPERFSMQRFFGWKNRFPKCGTVISAILGQNLVSLFDGWKFSPPAFGFNFDEDIFWQNLSIFVFLFLHSLNFAINLKKHSLESLQAVWPEKLPNVYKSCLKIISVEKWYILTPKQKMPKNVGDLDKIIVAKGFKRLPKVQ